MNAVSDKQTQFIQRLCAERTQALAGEFAHLLGLPLSTTRDASVLIDALKRVPVDPKPVDEAEQGRIDALKQAVPSLSPRDAAFALSLIGQYEERGRLSDKQWPHVDRLAQPQAEAKCDPQPGDIIQTDDGTLFLIVASKSGRPYAKVLVGGKWSYESGAIQRARQGTVLTGEALAKVASEYGIAHGHCMFCGLELTDGRSVDVGYGPTCASKHGLPWG